MKLSLFGVNDDVAVSDDDVAVSDDDGVELPGSDDVVAATDAANPVLFGPEQIPLRGAHNARNVTAAITAA